MNETLLVEVTAACFCFITEDNFSVTLNIPTGDFFSSSQNQMDDFSTLGGHKGSLFLSLTPVSRCWHAKTLLIRVAANLVPALIMGL